MGRKKGKNADDMKPGEGPQQQPQAQQQQQQAQQSQQSKQKQKQQQQQQPQQQQQQPQQQQPQQQPQQPLQQQQQKPKQKQKQQQQQQPQQQQPQAQQQQQAQQSQQQPQQQAQQSQQQPQPQQQPQQQAQQSQQQPQPQPQPQQQNKQKQKQQQQQQPQQQQQQQPPQQQQPQQQPQQPLQQQQQKPKQKQKQQQQQQPQQQQPQAQQQAQQSQQQPQQQAQQSQQQPQPQQQPQQQAQQSQQQQQPQPQQQNKPKQKQQQQQQPQQEQPGPQQQQPQQHPKQNKQKQPQQQQPQQPSQSSQPSQQDMQRNAPKHPRAEGSGAVPRDQSVASTKSSGSGSGDGVLKSIDEDLKRMRVDKEKLRRTDLRPVLCRPGAHGSRGMKVTVEANFFRLLIDKLVGTAYLYDVSIMPDTPKKFFRPVFAQFCAENYPNQRFAYDGQKIAYSAKAFPAAKGKLMFAPQDGGKVREYTVQVKQATTVDLSSLKSYMNSNMTNMAKPMSAIQCMDVVLRCAYETNPNFVRFKRCVYAVPRQRIDLGSAHELWFGLFQSALLGTRPYLNVDISHKAFPSSGHLLQIIASFNKGNVDQLDRWVLPELTAYLKGMDVVYRNPGGVVRRMRCHGLRDPADQQRFRLDDGTQLTVADYFRQRLNYPLRYPKLPVLHVGSSVRNVYVPAELCEIPPGQALNKNHPEGCTAAIIKYAATSTDVRKQKIMGLASQVNYARCPTILDFGIGVGNDFEKVEARIIDPPSIQYANQQVVKPMRGVWRAEGKPFIEPSTSLSKKPLRWRILNLDQQTNESAISTFGNMLYEQAKRCNVQMEPFSMRETFVVVRNMRDSLRDLGTIMENIKKENPTITIVVLPFRGEVYSKVKQKAELASERIGLLTQCIKAFTVQRKGTDMSTINNIMLKINAKTNGANHCLAAATVPPLGRGNVMYIGADVTHPLSDDVPSVVGVAAMYDLSGFRYNCSVRLQGARDEMIRDLENIVHRQILLYGEYNRALPDRIMYFRDGVSDGQFSEILTIELQALHAAIGRVKPGYKPAVTFIVVQKRHHTRFFPTPKCPTEGKNNNVPPGTIVDREITAPDRFEFYLVSHAAVQGVAKPTKYVVLYDDSNCSPDMLQALTYNLCHMFARCNRAVSYPAPTYYAHLAAYRGRVYIKDRRIDMNNLEAAYRNIQIIPEVTDKNPMFFV